MDPIFLLFAAIPVLIAIGGKLLLPRTINWLEFGLMIGLSLLVLTGTWFGGRFSAAWDTELWNGQVTEKRVLQQSCPQGWIRYTDDFCTEYTTRVIQEGQTCSTDSKGNTTCTPIYVTEYWYLYAWERKYPVLTNIDITYWIDRVDPQGAREPPRFTQVRVGDAVTKTSSYNNWIRAAADSLFHEDGAAEQKYLAVLPAYPDRVYDYYHVDRVLTVGNVQVPRVVNAQLEDVLKLLGPTRQMNAVLVVVDASTIGDDFPYALRRHWQGFKKNDAVVVIGVQQGVMQWAQVMSWSKRSLFDIQLREALLAQRNQPVDFTQVVQRIAENGPAYERRSMKEFEFLKDQIPVPMWLTILALVLSVGGTSGLLWFFHHNDVTTQGVNNSRGYR